MLACSYRELVELTRDPIRMTMAGLGTVILMIIMGYGISLDVEHLKYAVLDRDQTNVSPDYALNIAGSSRYFTERPPVADYDELDRRMKSGELSMVLEIPPGFGRDVERRLNGVLAAANADGQPSPGAGVGQLKPVAIGVWIDGSMPHARRNDPRLRAAASTSSGSRKRPSTGSVSANSSAWVSANWSPPPRSSCAIATTPTSRACRRWCRPLSRSCCS